MVRGGRRWRVLMTAVALVIVALVLVVRAVGFLSALEQGSIDLRFALRGDHRTPDVVVIGLDERSYDALPRPPLPRALDAEVVSRLHRAGARVIAYDLSFERPGPTRSGDEALISALERARPATVGVTGTPDGYGTVDPLAGRAPFSSLRGVRPGESASEIPDSDGSLRSYPGSFDGIAGFASVAASEFTGHTVTPPARSLIDYAGGLGTVPEISLVNVLDGDFPAKQVRGRVAVIGYTAAVLQDVHEAPGGGGGIMSGPEIVANEIQTAIDGFPLRYAAPALDTVLLVLLALAWPMASVVAGPRRLDGLWVIGLGGFGLVAWSVLVQLLFDGGTVLDYCDGMFAIALSTAATWGATGVLERRERRELRKRFAAFDSSVVNPVINSEAGSALAADRVIAGFQIAPGPPIGRGGMGVVWRARQVELKRDVALKLLLPQYAFDDGYRERFSQEVLNAAAISHPHIVPVFLAGEDSPLLYLAMQLIDAPNLEWVLRDGSLPPSLAARVGLQIGDALDAAHRPPTGPDGEPARPVIIHRDVKPANVLLVLTPGLEHAFLTDFGLATNAVTQARASNHASGSVDYMAPEQIQGEVLSVQTDVYALAALLFHALTGRVPFPAETTAEKLTAHLSAPRPRVSELKPRLGEGIDEVIARGMAIDPAQRFASAGALARAAMAALEEPTDGDELRN